MNGKSLCALAAVFILAGCASPAFPPQTADETGKIPAEKRIEISLAPGSFDVTEVEFHVDKESLPVSITKRAREEMPDGRITDAEIEYHDGVVYYEVTCEVGGKEQEVMFTAGGQVYRWEMDVDASKVPPKIMDRARAACAGAELTKAEQILDGSKNLLEYHFKMTRNDIKYKVVCPLNPGMPVTVFRETIAEIEVPM